MSEMIYCEWEHERFPANQFSAHADHGMVHDTDPPHTITGLPITAEGWSGSADMEPPPAAPAFEDFSDRGGGTSGGGDWSAPAAPPPPFE